MESQPMSNEELAVLIQSGQTELLGQLWDQTQKFIAMQCRQYYKICLLTFDSLPFDLDDLTQEAYIALARAANWFNGELGYGFLTALKLCLKATFAQISGTRLASQKNDAIRKAISGDIPKYDDSEVTLLESMPDNDGLSPEDEVVIDLYREQLHDVLDKAMALLPPKQAEVLREYYYVEKTMLEISEQYGQTTQNISLLHKKGLESLYRARKLNGLDAYLEANTNYYQMVGVKQFQSTFESAVEKIVIQREQKAEAWLKRQTESEAKMQRKIQREAARLMRQKGCFSDGNDKVAARLCQEHPSHAGQKTAESVCCEQDMQSR